MKALLGSLIGFALVAGIGPAAAAPGPTVYTWTDASGTTHFSDKPPATGTAQKLVLPSLPPPNREALAAMAAWATQLDKDTQKMLDREAAARRAEAQAAVQTPVVGSYPQYAPAFFSYGPRHFFHRHRFNEHDRDDLEGRNRDQDHMRGVQVVTP